MPRCSHAGSGSKIGYATIDTLADRYGTNLAAMHNALVLAAIAAAEPKADGLPALSGRHRRSGW